MKTLDAFFLAIAILMLPLGIMTIMLDGFGWVLIITGIIMLVVHFKFPAKMGNGDEND